MLVRESFEASRKRCGSPRVWRDPREQDVHVSRKRVVRLMQEQGLRARARKIFKSTTASDHDRPVAANLLNREFKAAARNQRWVCDTSEFVVGSSGKQYPESCDYLEPLYNQRRRHSTLGQASPTAFKDASHSGRVGKLSTESG